MDLNVKTKMARKSKNMNDIRLNVLKVLEIPVCVKIVF